MYLGAFSALATTQSAVQTELDPVSHLCRACLEHNQLGYHQFCFVA